MFQALKEALDRADKVIERVQQRIFIRKYLNNIKTSIFQKLCGLYAEEYKKEPKTMRELRNANLLEKLVMRERLSLLVVNLYPGGGGYSVMLRAGDGSESVTIGLPYEEREMLDYLDAEELPPILIDLLEKSPVSIFYSGCVIAEVRDYRQCSNMQAPSYQSRYIILYPIMQMLTSGVHTIASNDPKWTQEDSRVPENQLSLATSEPRCLDPSVAVACTENSMICNKQKMNTHPMNEGFKGSPQSQPPELFHCPPPPQPSSFLSCQKNEERNTGQQNDLTTSNAENYVDMCPYNLVMPFEMDVENYEMLEEFITPDASQPTLEANCEVDDAYLFDCETDAQYQQILLNVMPSLNDPLLSGTILPDEEDEESDSKRPPSHFSTDGLLDWVMNKATTAAEHQDLVQKEAECPVKESCSSNSSASLCQLSPRKETEQPQRVSIHTSVSKNVQHSSQSIQLPSSSGSNSAVNYSTPQQASGFLKPATTSASKPQISSQKSSVHFNQARTLSPMVTSFTSSAQRTQTTPVMANFTGLNSINTGDSVCITKASGNGSNPVPDRSPDAKTPAEVHRSGCLASEVLPTEVPSVVQTGSQESVPLVLNKTSVVEPLTLLQLPDGQLIFVSQQQRPVSQLVVQFPQHRPTLPQRAVEQGFLQGSTSQAQALPTQQGILIKLPQADHFVPSQAAALCQRRPEHSRPQPRFQVPSAFPQQQPQVKQVKILSRPVAEAKAATYTAQPRRQWHMSSQSKGKMKTGTSTIPNPES